MVEHLDGNTVIGMLYNSQAAISGFLPKIGLMLAFDTKFSLPSFLKQVNRLTDSQRNSIKKMGFGSLLLIPNQLLRRYQLIELMDRWSCEKCAFILPPGEITITPLDVALILGLRVRGEPVVLKEDAPFTELERELGISLWNRTITVSSINAKLEALGERDDECFVRLFLLFSFGKILFANVNGKVDSRYLFFLQDLDKTRRFAWGAAVLQNLYDCLSHRKKNNAHCIGGCLILLQIWCYEHITLGRPKHSIVSLLSSTFPRVCRWENISRAFIRSQDDRQLFAMQFKELKHNQILWRILPTLEESKIDIIRELIEEDEDADYGSIDKEDDVRIMPELPQQRVDIESDTNSEMVVIHGEEETLRQPENELLTLKNAIDIPSTLHIVQLPKGQGERPYNFQGKSQILIIGDDDGDNSSTRSETLEEQNIRLKKEIEELRKENELLKGLREENVQMSKEVETLRRECQVLSLSRDRGVVNLSRAIGNLSLLSEVVKVEPLYHNA